MLTTGYTDKTAVFRMVRVVFLIGPLHSANSLAISIADADQKGFIANHVC